MEVESSSQEGEAFIRIGGLNMSEQPKRSISNSKPDEPTLFRIDSSAPSGDIEPAELDVVFVHGFIGTAHGTWTHEEFVWPEQLEKDLNSNVCPARVWVLDYNAPARQNDPPKFLKRGLSWFSKGAEELSRGEQLDITLSLKQRAEFLCKGVLEGEDRLGERPIVFVAHSLGGLIVKAMLEGEWITQGDKSRILRNTKAVVFLGTPHSGAALADLAVTLSTKVEEGAATLGGVLAGYLGASVSIGATIGEKLGKWILGPSETLKSLSEDNPELFALMQSYRRIAKERSIETLSCYETRNLKIAIVVSRSSADPGLGDFVAVEGANHATICKPRSEDALVYRMVRQVIVRAAAKAQRTTKRPVFDEPALQIFRALRTSRFSRLPKFAWEVTPVSGTLNRQIADLPADLPNPADSNWSTNVERNFRRRVAVEFFRLCEAQLREGALAITDADAAAAEHSQFDVDKLILVAWRKHCLERAIRDARLLIEDQCAYVRGTYKPTLTILYRAIDSLDKALTDQLTLSLGTELRLVREAIAARAKTEEKLDGDGITRTRIDDLVAKVRAMAEVALTSEQIRSLPDGD
jgi:hypothetical protein